MPDEPGVPLDARTRRLTAVLLVGLALVHLFFPALAIDGVFLGLLAMAAIVLLFDIKSVDALGVKATARRLRASTEAVEEASIPQETELPAIPERRVEAPEPPTSTMHREPQDLMPPTERAARILWAFEQIRVELIVLAGARGLLPPGRPWSDYRVPELAPLLADRGAVPKAFIEPLASLRQVRNDIAHGRHVHQRLVAETDELALILVSRLRQLPRTYTRVLEPRVVLFKDQSLTTPHSERGVLIEQRDRDGETLVQQVFPTAQDYGQGRYVSWEWDLSHGTDEEAWYADPVTGETKMAFSSSAVFAGREFPEQWGLRYRAGPLLDF